MIIFAVSQPNMTSLIAVVLKFHQSMLFSLLYFLDSVIRTANFNAWFWDLLLHSFIIDKICQFSSSLNTALGTMCFQLLLKLNVLTSHGGLLL